MPEGVRVQERAHADEQEDREQEQGVEIGEAQHVQAAALDGRAQVFFQVPALVAGHVILAGGQAGQGRGRGHEHAARRQAPGQARHQAPVVVHVFDNVQQGNQVIRAGRVRIRVQEHEVLVPAPAAERQGGLRHVRAPHLAQAAHQVQHFPGSATIVQHLHAGARGVPPDLFQHQAVAHPEPPVAVFEREVFFVGFGFHGYPARVTARGARRARTAFPGRRRWIPFSEPCRFS